MRLECKTISQGKDKKLEATSTVTQHIVRSGKRWSNVSPKSTDFGFDDSNYWMQLVRVEPRKIEPPRYRFKTSDAVTFALQFEKFDGTLEYIGEGTLRGKQAYRIKVEPAKPEPINRTRMTPLEFWFSVETGLLLKIVTESQTEKLSNYREVDGIMIPHRRTVIWKSDDLTCKFLITVSSVEFNVDVDEELVLPFENKKASND